jgi:hypothetical protein
MKSIDRLLQESFANYAGWYLTEKYYANIGYVSSPREDISGQARQISWTSKTEGEMGYYSPLFVDLVDNFNQAVYFGSSYNNDMVKGVHYSVIMRIARESTDWASCRSILEEYETFTGQDPESFLAPYEAWYENGQGQR